MGAIEFETAQPRAMLDGAAHLISSSARSTHPLLSGFVATNPLIKLKLISKSVLYNCGLSWGNIALVTKFTIGVPCFHRRALHGYFDLAPLSNAIQWRRRRGGCGLAKAAAHIHAAPKTETSLGLFLGNGSRCSQRMGSLSLKAPVMRC